MVRCRRTSSGAQRVGSVAKKITTLGTPTPTATCDTPVSFVTSIRAFAKSAASAPIETDEAKLWLGLRIARATALVIDRSALEPVSTIS
jgi:hypothetical protein